MQDNTVKEFTVQIDSIKGIYRANLRGVVDEVVRLHLNQEYTLLFDDEQIHEDINIQINQNSVALVDLEQHQMKQGDVVTIRKRDMCTEEDLRIVELPDPWPEEFFLNEKVWQQERIKQKMRRAIKNKYDKKAADPKIDPFQLELSTLLNGVPFGKTEITQSEPCEIRHKFLLNKGALTEWRRREGLNVLKLIADSML